MRAFLCIGLFCVAVGAIGLIEPVSADNNQTLGWGGKYVSVISEGPDVESGNEWAACSGKEAKIALRDATPLYSACVFGDTSQVRMARYLSGRGIFEYAIAYPYENEFTEIRGLCTMLIRCTYSPGSDALFIQTPIAGWNYTGVIYKNVTKQLIKRVDTTTWYEFLPTSNPIELRTEDILYTAGAASFSKNGRWAVVELHDYGILRIDMETDEIRRVVAPGARYGVAKDPTYELAVSNDGKQVAVMGWRLGLDVFEVNETCGDTLAGITGRNYQPGVENCPNAMVEWNVLFPGFSAARKPAFSDSGRQLGVTVTTYSGISRAIISPFVGEPDIRSRYVALGDSFTSGEGETSDRYYVTGTNTPINKCHVSTRSYPFLLGEKWELDATNVACSGARIADVLKENGIQLNELARIQPEIVTVGMGGNDAGLMDKLKGCVMPSVCGWATSSSLRGAVAKEIQGVADRLIELLSAIKSVAPRSKIVVIGYPLVVSESLEDQCGLPLSAMLSPEERVFMNESVRYLNSVMYSVAQSQGVNFANVERVFEGRELCSGSSTAMNGIRIGDDIAPISALPSMKIIGAESFHPTPFGHGLVATAISEQYATTKSVTQCLWCTQAYTAPPLSSYWTEGMIGADRTDQRLVSYSFTDKASYQPNEGALLTTPSLFQAHSKVNIEIHSDPMKIGESTTDESGKFDETIEFPSTIGPGYHTLHLYGTSPHGELVDVYSTVWIEGSAGDEDTAISDIKTTGGLAGSESKQEKEALGGALIEGFGESNLLVPQSTLGQSINIPAQPVVAEKKVSDRGREWIAWLIGGGVIIALVLVLFFASRTTSHKTG